MQPESESPSINKAPRVKLLVGILALCLAAVFLYHFFRVPPTANHVAGSSEATEPTKVVVEIPSELLQTPAEYLATDVNSLNTIRQDEDIARARSALTAFLWGYPDLPATTPTSVLQDISDERYADVAAIERIDKLLVSMEFGLESYIYHFLPKSPNSQVVLYHQGHRGDFHQSKGQIASFLENGYSVVALSMPLLGLNNQPTVQLPRFGQLKLIDHDNLKFLTPDKGHSLQFFVEPVVAAVNYLENQYDYAGVSMVGISGGGWTTVIAAALDIRISRSFSVAGSYPLYLRSNSRRDWGDYEQTVPELYRTVNYIELYTLGAHGHGRSQLQIINQLDACCFGGTKWETYVPHLKARLTELGSGEFDLYLDDTHMDHALSGVSMARILGDLAKSVEQPN
jgi:hypothetical protein